MAICAPVLEVCKLSSAANEYGFYWTDEFAIRWKGDRFWAAGSHIRPTKPFFRVGLEYISSGGVSAGKREPKWTNQPIQDGEILWTPTEPSYDGLRERISTSVWTVPAGLSGSSETSNDEPSLQQTLITLEGGTVGTTYNVVNTVTTTRDNVYVGVIYLTIDPFVA